MVAKTDVVNRKRQPKGIPVGGEFASNEHDEASVGLVEYTTTARGTKLEAKKALSHRELLSESRTAARIYGERKNLTPDECEEAASATLAEIWGTYGEKHARDEDGKLILDENGNRIVVREAREIDGALVNYVAKKQVGKTMRGGVKALLGDSAMAHTEFNREIEYQSEELGRELTSRERDAIAADIRDNWHDQAHKPAEGFHLHGSREKSINYVPGSYEGDDYVHPALIDPYSPEAALESRGDHAEAALDKLNSVSGKALTQARSDMRLEAWGIISSDSGVPPVSTKLSDAERKTYSAQIKSNGGVAAAIARFDDGEEDGSTAALFAPFRERTGPSSFRELRESEKEEIVDVLRRNSSMADSLWASAIASAK